MQTGELIGIYIADSKQAEPRPVAEVRAVPGRGLEGDRYFHQLGTYSEPGQTDREVTLIEVESIEALARDHGIQIAAGKTRRNLVTRGVALNELVGREFVVGEVRLRGLRLCAPCSHLEGLTAAGVERGLVDRGGLRAQILTEGVLHGGDDIRLVD